MKAAKDLATLLSSESPAKVAELLQGLLSSPEVFHDLPESVAEAVVHIGLDGAAPAATRTLAYQIICAGAATSSSHRFLDTLLAAAALDLAGEDKELGLLAVTAVFASLRDEQLVSTFRNTAFTLPIKSALASADTLVRQSMVEVLGRALPRLMRVLDAPHAASGTFPSIVDALRFRQDARDVISDLGKQFLEMTEDAEDAVSGAAFTAVEALLEVGCPRLLSPELAVLLGLPEKDSLSPGVQELCISFCSLFLSRLSRLLIRFGSLRKGWRRGAASAISRLILLWLLENTSSLGILLPPSQNKSSLNAAPNAAVRWMAPGCAVQLASEWVNVHLAQLAQSTEAMEAYVALTWTVELLHIPALRRWRKNRGYQAIDGLLRLPCLAQIRSVRPFLQRLNEAQAAIAVYAVAALKWISLSFYEAIVPRLLQVIRGVDNDGTRAGLIGEVVALMLCDVQRNGRMQDPWLLQNLLSDDWLAAALIDDSLDTKFREELLTAVILTLLKLSPIVFLPIGLTLKLGNLLDRKIRTDLSYYARVASVTRITRRAITRPLANLTMNASHKNLQPHLSNSSSIGEDGSGPFWADNCGRWAQIAVFSLQRLSFCANWPSTSAYSTFSLYITLLSLTCAVLLSPMAQRLPMPTALTDELKERVKSVLLDLIEFRLPEGVTSLPQRLKLLRILAHYSGAMGSNDDIREQTALDVVHFLEKELGDQEALHEYKRSLARRADGPLGGAVLDDSPKLDQSVWRAKVAIRSLQQVALNVKPVSPVVISVLNSSIAGMPSKPQGPDRVFRDEVLLALRRIHACGGGSNDSSPSVNSSHGPRSPPTPTPVAHGMISFDQFTGEEGEPHESRQAPDEHVLLIESMLPPSIEPDERVILEGSGTAGASYDYWMTVYSALTQRLNRLIKTVPSAPQDRHSASNLFKRMDSSLPAALTGGSDPVYLTLEHSVDPGSRQLSLRAKAYNATNCKLDGLLLHLILLDKARARLAHGTRGVAELTGTLEPGACFEGTFTLDVLQFGDIKVAIDLVFPAVEIEVEEYDLDLETADDGVAPEAVERTASEDIENAPRSQLVPVTTRSGALSIPFINFLRPPPEYELLLPSFQDIWSSLPYNLSRPVETDVAVMHQVLSWHAQRPASNTEAASTSLGAEDIISLMNSAPFLSNKLLPVDQYLLSLKEASRVTNKVRSVPFVSGEFFSEAWLFRTWSGGAIAAVLTGLSTAGLGWRGRVEIRCNDAEMYKLYVARPEPARRFIIFLTNGLFGMLEGALADSHDVFQPSQASQMGCFQQPNPQSLLEKWKAISDTRRILGLHAGDSE